MPTPKQYASQNAAIRPMDGPVPGLTWDQFVQQFASSPGGTSAGTFRTGDVSGLGRIYGQQQGAAYGGGEGGSAGPALMDPNSPLVYMQDIGDGTRNTYYRGDEGGLLSKNETINNDSWWDSTGLPLLTAAGFTAGIGALGGFGGAAAAGAAGSGAAGEGLGAGATGAFDLGGTVGGVQGAGGYAAGLGDAFGVGAGAAGVPGGVGAGQGFGPGTGAGVTDYGAAGEGMLQGQTGAFDMGGSFGGVEGAGGVSNTFGGSPWYQSLLGKAGSNPLSSLANIFSGGGTGADYWSAISGIGVPLANGILGSHAASNAAKTQANAANQSNALLSQIYGDNVARNQPYVNAGSGALNLLTNPAAAKAAFQTDPGYDFAFGQGQRAVQSSAAARGGLYSGRAAKDLTTFGQGIADQQYGNFTGRQMDLARLGQSAANNTASMGTNYAGSYGNNLTSGAAALAAGSLGATNAWTNALSSALGNYQQNDLLARFFGQQNGNGFYPRNPGGST